MDRCHYRPAWRRADRAWLAAKHEPTRETREIVKALSCFGVKQAKISEYIDVDEKTLRLYYRYEIDHGRDMATSEVVRSL
jgi:hypothetical protein